MIFNGPVVYGTSYKGKLYVGQHIGNGIDYVGSGLLISRIIKKGYKNKLITGVIEYVDDVKKLSEREIYWIEKLKPKLNLTKGGETWGIGKDNIMNRPDVKIKFIGNNNPMRRPEVAKKLSLSKKGKMVWDCRGNNNPMRRPEIAKKVSEAFKKFGENHWNKKPEMRKRFSEMKKGVPMLKIRGVNNPSCKEPSKLFISYRKKCVKYKWLVRVPNNGYKSFEILGYAQKYRDKLIGVN
jgi:hypothetical protein